MSNDDEETRAYKPIHPGEVLREQMEARGVSNRELARRTGLADSYISHVLVGRRGITANAAIEIGKALGTGGMFWATLQARYELELEKEKREE